MRRVLVASLIVVLVLLVAAQVVVPRVISGKVEDRLEERGGTAAVSISAWPVATLAFGSGRSIEVAGHDLRYELGTNREERPLERLDSFRDVRVDLEDLEAGPVRLTSFVLTREGRDQPYRLSMRGRTTPGELAGELGNATGGRLGGFLGAFATGALSSRSATPVPLRLDATVESSDGRPDVSDAQATVAGLPAGPLTVIVLRSVLDRL